MPKRRLAGFVAALVVALPLAAASLEKPMHDVEQIRGLKFLHPVQTIALDRSTLPSMLRKQMEKGMPYSWDDYMVVLHSLHLVDQTTGDLQGKLLALLDQQVLAFYDPDSHVYYSIKQPPSGLPEIPNGVSLDESVAAHELTHALQDQHFDLGKRDRALRDETDAGMALHAVAEGEATLVMLGDMTAPMGATIDQIVKNDMMLNAMTSASAAMTNTAGAPRYFVESLAFPYVSGLKFIVAAYRKGGWVAVNHIYDSPPQSTREILHPEEYFAGKRTANAFDEKTPLPIREHLLTVEHLGEFHWGFLVGADNARGWEGDRVTIAQNEFCEPTVLVQTKWETPAQATTFRTAYAAFLKKEKVDAHFDTRGNEVDAAYGVDDVLIDQFIAR
jgi:hypothetical protein